MAPNENKSKKLLEKEGIGFDQVISGIENISVPIHIVMLDGKIVFANKTCAVLAGLNSSRELVGKRCYEIFKSDYCYTEKCPLKIYTENIELNDNPEVKGKLKSRKETL